MRDVALMLAGWASGVTCTLGIAAAALAAAFVHHRSRRKP